MNLTADFDTNFQERKLCLGGLNTVHTLYSLVISTNETVHNPHVRGDVNYVRGYNHDTLM